MSRATRQTWPSGCRRPSTRKSLALSACLHRPSAMLQPRFVALFRCQPSLLLHKRRQSALVRNQIAVFFAQVVMYL